MLDASAVLALLRDEPGADIVAGHMGNAAISAVNLQEVAKEMFREGASCADVRAILGELALDVRAHDTEAAYASPANSAVKVRPPSRLRASSSVTS